VSPILLMRSGRKLSSKNFRAPSSSSGIAAIARVQISLSAPAITAASRLARLLVTARQLVRKVENAARDRRWPSRRGPANRPARIAYREI